MLMTLLNCSKKDRWVVEMGWNFGKTDDDGVRGGMLAAVLNEWNDSDIYEENSTRKDLK